MLGIILAGGNGTRFAPEGCCKPLLKINGKYLIEYALENLIPMNVDKALIVAGKYKDELEAALGSRYKSITVSYALQENPVGVINALFCALPYWNGETVVLQLSDEILRGFNAAPAAAADADFVCGYTLTNDKNAIKENYAVYCEGRGRKLLSCEEKPKTVHNRKKGTGFCIFSPACISLLRERYPDACDHYVTLCDFMNVLIAEGKRGFAVPIAKEEININTKDKLAYAERVITAKLQ